MSVFQYPRWPRERCPVVLSSRATGRTMPDVFLQAVPWSITSDRDTVRDGGTIISSFLVSVGCQRLLHDPVIEFVVVDGQ